MKEICIAGGGVRGIAFLGALHELENMGKLKNIKVYAGSSIGGFFALLIILGYKTKEIIDELFKIDITSLKDFDLKHILHNKSIMKGEKIKEFIRKLILKKEKLETTLKELYEKTKIKLIVTVTCVEKGVAEYFSYENHPDISIYKLICMTTSIPFIFPPEIYNGFHYADGGIIDNLPLKMLSEESIGITAISDNEKFEFNFTNYVIRILTIIYKNLQHSIIDKYKERVIKINTKHIKVTSFDITNDEKLMLIHRGINSVKEFNH